MTELLPRLLAAFFPVLIFLSVLIYLDSYKLVRFRWVIFTIVLGGVAAAISYLANVLLLTYLSIDFLSYTRYGSPIVEELAKALVIVWLIRSHRIGFLVDASIFGFAVGTGFALVENAYYLKSIPDSHLVIWLVRGLGTAVMHGGTTSLFAICSQLFVEFRSPKQLSIFLPGLINAALAHSLFNQLLFSPLLSTLATLVVFPLMIFVVFEKSEESLEKWLEVGFDADTELLELMYSGRLSESKVGKFLQSLRERFSGETVVDLLCYLRLYLELSLRAKGILMMREGGFTVAPDEETRALFTELRSLERRIGKTGKLALAPFLHISGKELWQLYMIAK